MNRLTTYWRPSLVITILIVIVAALIWLQMKPTMQVSRGGLHRFTSQQSYGWPRRNALQRVEHHNRISDAPSPFTIRTSTIDTWNNKDIAINVSICFLILASTIVSLSIFVRQKRPFQIDSQTLIVTAFIIMITGLLYSKEYVIHQTLCQSDSIFVNLELHDLHSLQYYELIPTLAGIAFTVFVAMLLTWKSAHGIATLAIEWNRFGKIAR